MASPLPPATPPADLCPICRQPWCSLAHLRHRLTAPAARPPQEPWRSERLAHGMLVFGLMVMAFLCLWHSLAPMQLNFRPDTPEPTTPATTIVGPVAGHGQPSHHRPR